MDKGKMSIRACCSVQLERYLESDRIISLQGSIVGSGENLTAASLI